jgi:putative Mn2+ efflux pump MntP
VRAAQALAMATVFALLQGLMPLLGSWLGHEAGQWIDRYDHWIALALLGGIGVKMIVEALRRHPEEPAPWPGRRALLLLGLATSLDALVAGLSLGLLGLRPLLAAALIAAVTFVLVLAGIAVGRRIGPALGTWSELAGGALLIGIGAKIALDHVVRQASA